MRYGRCNRCGSSFKDDGSGHALVIILEPGVEQALDERNSYTRIYPTILAQVIDRDNQICLRCTEDLKKSYNLVAVPKPKENK